MTETLTQRFSDALDALGVSHTRTTPDDFAETVSDAVHGDAIGVQPGGELSLPDCVETEPTNGDLEAAETGVTAASFAIAETGSVYLEADAAGTEPVSLYPFRHVAVLRGRDVVADVPAAIERFAPLLRDGGSGIVSTGPSATADMGELIVGAHGPGEVHVVVVEDPERGSNEAVEVNDE